MGRRDYDDDDDDDDRDDDRPVRRPRKEGGGGKTVLIVVGIISLVILLIVGSCLGLGYYAFWSAKKSVTAFGDSMRADSEAQSFLGKLKGSPQTAYDSMAPSYKATTTRDQFQQIVNRYPPLTKHVFPRKTTYNPITGSSPNRKEVVSYELTDNTFEPEPFTQPGQPKIPRPIPGPKTCTATMTVAEQPDGSWKVESFSVQ